VPVEVAEAVAVGLKVRVAVLARVAVEVGVWVAEGILGALGGVEQPAQKIRLRNVREMRKGNFFKGGLQRMVEANRALGARQV